MLLTGQFDHIIDAKKRMAIPAEVRAQWDSSADGDAWYAVPWRSPDGLLVRLYTETTFRGRASNLPATLTPDEDEAELQTILFGLTARLTLDSAGRIRIPDEVLELVGLGSEVTIIGAGDRLEIRDRATWKASVADRLAKLPALMSRISAKQTNGGT